MQQTTKTFPAIDMKAKKSILALSWNIATEPKLYWKLAPNPYTSSALEIISERFPESDPIDIIKAVVFAEPEGKYDRSFKLLPKLRQTNELRKQKDVSTEINKRLVQYCKKHAKELCRLPKEFVYESLSLVVFGTADIKKIEQSYSQNQRRDFRLAIVNFIEVKLDSYRQKKKPSRKWVWFLVVFAGLYLLLLFFLIQITAPHKEDSRQILSTATKKDSQGLPVHLKIPSINVDVAIESVGITSNGAMEVPGNTVDVGWFNLGPRPGDIGSAVIDGHFDGEHGEAGVFTNLYKIKEGDKLYIEEANGTPLTFIVRKTSIYNPGYADEVFSRNDKAHLNLITCDGVWDEETKSYSKRLVVFADMQ